MWNYKSKEGIWKETPERAQGSWGTSWIFSHRAAEAVDELDRSYIGGAVWEWGGGLVAWMVGWEWWGREESLWLHSCPCIRGEEEGVVLDQWVDLYVMGQELIEGYKDYLERMNTHTYEIVDGELSLAV
jgi:hypothetical protein